MELGNIQWIQERKGLAVSALLLLFTTSSYAQRTMSDLIGLPVDSLPELCVDSLSERKGLSATTQREAPVVTRSCPNANIPEVPTSYTINQTSATVGEIPCNVSVSPTGALTAIVPLEAVPDPAGFTPTVSLSYSSMTGNGPLGYGWQITGISTLIRASRTIYYDGVTQGIEGEKDDALYLDGIRLIRVSITDSEAHYLSETGNIKARAEISGDDISNVTVFYPDGSKILFLYRDVNGFHPYIATDKNGNTVEFVYTIQNSHWRIQSITYGKDDQLEIVFNYTANTATHTVPQNGVAGFMVSYPYLLSSVSLYSTGSLVRTYNLGYTANDYVQLLSTVGCQSFTTAQLNPLHFYYGIKNNLEYYTTDSTQLSQWYSYTEPAQIAVSRGKFDYGKDNDGVLIFPNKFSYYKNGNAIQNQYTGNEDIFVNTCMDNPLAITHTIKTGQGFTDIFCVNLDEYEGDEVVRVNNKVSGGNDIMEFTVYSPNLYNLSVSQKYQRTYSHSSAVSGCTVPKSCLVGDFNGDGRMDVMTFSSNTVLGSTVGSKCYIYDLEGNTLLYSGTPFQYEIVAPASLVGAQLAYNQSDKLLPIDYDGDGKTDLLHITQYSCKAYSFSYDSGVLTCHLVNTGLLPYGYFINDKQLLIGEFNGNGKTDLLMTPLTGNSDWTLYYSKGDGTFLSTSLNICERSASMRMCVQDMNHDGQTDLICADGTNITTYYLSNLSNINSASATVADKTIVVPVNIRGRNEWYSLMSIGNNGVVSKIQCNDNEGKRRLLTGVIGSHGKITRATYASLNDTDVAPFFTAGSDHQFPYYSYRGDLTVCTRLETYFYNTKRSDTHIEYKDAIIHRQGLGFRGFKETYSYEDITGDYARCVYDPYQFMVLLSEDGKTETNIYDYAITVSPDKTARLTVGSKESVNKVNGVESVTEYSYDSFDNVTEESTDYGNGYLVEVERTYQNIESGDVRRLGLMTSETRTTTRGDSSVVQSEHVTYGTNYLPINRKDYYNNNLTQEEDITYNSNNLVTERSMKLFGSTNARTNHYTYNQYGQVTTHTDEKGLTTSFTYDMWGNPETKTDYLGNTTTYQGDCWGRIIQVEYPDETFSYKTISWETSSNPLYSVLEETPGKPDKKTYYDAWGQVYRVREKHFDGNWFVVYYQYDSQGRLYRASQPARVRPTKWTTYSYDSFNRLTSTTYPSGRVDTYAYDGLVKTETIDGVTRTMTHSPLGDVVEVVDAGGTITYQHDGAGNVVQITAPGNIVTSIQYDNYGRRISINDPSAGTTTIAYDGEGRKSSVTDASGRTATYSYDSFDRLVGRSFSGITATYTYDSNNFLTGETDSNGRNVVYTYDTYGRNISVRENGLDGTWFQKSCTYLEGRISSITYSSQSGMITTEGYNYGNGVLYKITAGGTNIYELTSETATGLPSTYTTGVISHTLTYDNENRVTSIRNSVGNGNRLYLQYSYDSSTGNLLSRTDNKRNLTEAFGYDSQNRLTQYGSQNMVYDNLGNITSNSLVGSYSYGSSRPYAVSGISQTGSMVPSNTQELSFNGLNRVDTIREGGYTAAFCYSLSGDRICMTVTNEITCEQSRKYYFSDQYEFEVSPDSTIREILYLGGDAYSASSAYIREGDGSWSLYYIGRDNLGSVMTVVDDTGNLVQELSYDAWGNLRDPSTHQLYNRTNAPTLFLGRGFTGHEHLTTFGLINMNARLYDPILGKFISPDPYIQAPYNSQNYNRYSYCLNNPLRYSDVSGKSITLTVIVVGAVVGGAINVATNWKKIDNFWQGLTYFGVGAAAGAVGGAVGAYVGGVIAMGGVIGGAVIGNATGFASGAILGAGNAWIEGGNIMSGLASGAFSGAICGTILGGVGGGVEALFKGQNIWMGRFNGTTIENNITNTSGTSVGELQLPNAVTTEIPSKIPSQEIVTDYNPNGLPPNNGALTEEIPTCLEPGDVVTRYAVSQERLNAGYYFAPEHTTPAEISLPSGDYMQATYEVAKPIFVYKSIATPWYNQTGLGTQYRATETWRTLIQRGLLKDPLWKFSRKKP